MQYVSTLIILEDDSQSQAEVWPLIQQWPEWSSTPAQHPDVHWYNWGPFAEDETPALKIETVRQLVADLSYGGYHSQNQVYLVHRIDTAGVPAQNALLKTVEEPPPGVRLVLTARDLAAVLPTIQSRCLVTTLTTPDSNQTIKFDETFQTKLYQQLTTASISDVLALVDEWGTDRALASQRLTALGQYLHTSQLQAHPTAGTTRHIQAVATALDQLKKNANVKLVLDQCFLTFR
jgi:hypothetical protein